MQPKNVAEWKWPPLMVLQKDASGQEVWIKPKIQRWQLKQIRAAAPTFGKCIGRSKANAMLWVLKGDDVCYSDVRNQKTGRYAALRAVTGAYWAGLNARHAGEPGHCRSNCRNACLVLNVRPVLHSNTDVALSSRVADSSLSRCHACQSCLD